MAGGTILIERAMGYGRHLADVFGSPVALPSPHLPFDERWAQAARLLPHQQAKFMHREIKSLFLVGKHIEGIDRKMIAASSLPTAIKEYMLIPSSSPYNLMIDCWDRIPNSASFRVRLSRTLNFSGEGPLWLDVSGELRPNIFGININKDSYITPWAFLFNDPQNPNPAREALQEHINEVGGLAVAQELIRFAHEVISARSQPPAPTPPAA